MRAFCRKIRRSISLFAGGHQNYSVSIRFFSKSLIVRDKFQRAEVWWKRRIQQHHSWVTLAGKIVDSCRRRRRTFHHKLSTWCSCLRLDSHLSRSKWIPCAANICLRSSYALFIHVCIYIYLSFWVRSSAVYGLGSRSNSILHNHRCT